MYYKLRERKYCIFIRLKKKVILENSFSVLKHNGKKKPLGQTVMYSLREEQCGPKTPGAKGRNTKCQIQVNEDTQINKKKMSILLLRLPLGPRRVACWNRKSVSSVTVNCTCHCCSPFSK